MRLPRTIGRAALLALAFVTFQGCAVMAEVEEPAFGVERSEPPFELRRYAPMIVAEVEVGGSREQAVNAGFRILADYIFGGNAPRETIEMTAPVTQSESPAEPAGEKIAMTAPVQQTGREGRWTVRFVMPSEWTLDTLPRPNDPRIALVPVPERLLASVRFSGVPRETRLAEKSAALDAWIAAAGLTPRGEPVYAFYDPPWTLPFLRRNEVLREVAR
ncbi:MAG: heme-binding protein [Alphaproteobacteria bacterium]|nr:heme-binding protein [Alphaproteobacteria bacterium]